MVSELQTVVVEHPRLASLVHETVGPPIRAPSKSPCLIRETSGAPFLFPRGALRDRCRCELPCHARPWRARPPAARPTCALGEQDLISAEHSGLSLPLPTLFKTDFYNPALRPYQPTRVRACKRHSPVVREPC